MTVVVAIVIVVVLVVVAGWWMLHRVGPDPSQDVDRFMAARAITSRWANNAELPEPNKNSEDREDSEDSDG